jgi:hypothetical protein
LLPPIATFLVLGVVGGNFLHLKIAVVVVGGSTCFYLFMQNVTIFMEFVTFFVVFANFFLKHRLWTNNKLFYLDVTRCL